MPAKGSSKGNCPLLQWQCAQVAPDSRLVLLGGDFHCNPGWSPYCVSVRTEIARVLLEFVVDVHLHPTYMHGMQGPTWVSAQGFAGALGFCLSRHVSPEVGVVNVENGAVFPSDHCLVRLRLLTLPVLMAPGKPIARARFKMGCAVSKEQQQFFADRCETLFSLPLATLPETYHHFVRCHDNRKRGSVWSSQCSLHRSGARFVRGSWFAH